jgi:hypothetical protein
MKDAVSLIDKHIHIKEINFKIVDFCFVPGSNHLYVKLKKSDSVCINYLYSDLLPYLIEQIKL